MFNIRPAYPAPKGFEKFYIITMIIAGLAIFAGVITEGSESIIFYLAPPSVSIFGYLRLKGYIPQSWIQAGGP
jgi:hypothetical protein